MPTVVRGRVVYMLVITSNRYDFSIDFSDIAAIATIISAIVVDPLLLKSNSIIIQSYFLSLMFFFIWPFNLSSLITQLVWILICYEIRATNYESSLAILFSLDNIWSINLDRCVDQVNIYLDLNYETFSLLVLTNILLYEGSTMFDCSLIIGNQINTLLSGLMVVFTLYYMVARHLYLIFISIFLYQFIFQNQYLLFLLNLIEFISIFFRVLTLPNRLSLNLFSGNLLITIFILPLIDHSFSQLIF